MKCALSKSPEDLARFWLDDLPEDEALALEEHAMDCAACYEGLRGLAEVGQTVRVVLATERLPPLPTPDQLIELRARLRLGIVHCAPGSTTTRPMERGTGGHAELTGVDRIDVDICSPAGKSSLLLPDAPFDRNSGEVILTCDRHTAQATSESLIRLLAGGGGLMDAPEKKTLQHPVEIRSMIEADLPTADRIMRVAFGTFLGVPEPAAFMGDASYVANRWKTNPGCAFTAVHEGEVVGSTFAARWGSVGFFGPLTVKPERWDMGIARRLMGPVKATLRVVGPCARRALHAAVGWRAAFFYNETPTRIDPPHKVLTYICQVGIVVS